MVVVELRLCNESKSLTFELQGTFYTTQKDVHDLFKIYEVEKIRRQIR